MQKGILNQFNVVKSNTNYLPHLIQFQLLHNDQPKQVKMMIKKIIKKLHA